MNDTVTLPPHLQDYVDRKVQSGEFADGVDVIAAALRAMRQRDEDQIKRAAEAAPGEQ